MAKNKKRLEKERTSLANERTWLAYIRTFITLLLGGVSLIKFFNDPLLVTVGVLLIIISFSILFMGLIKHKVLFNFY